MHLKDLWKSARPAGSPAPWIWILVAVLLAGLLANGLIPVPTSASETTRSLRTSLSVLLGPALVGVAVFALQAERARAERHCDVMRSAYSLLLKAAERITALKVERDLYPEGREYPGIVSNATASDFLKHNPYAEADALRAEMRQLATEAEVALVLEEGPEEPALQQWHLVNMSYMRWWMARSAKADDPPVDPETLKQHAKAVTANITKLRTICHERMRRL